MNCDRCLKTKLNNIKVSKHTCEICLYNLCNKCLLTHNQMQECFIDKQRYHCYMCNRQGVYDYGIEKFICIYHI